MRLIAEIVDAAGSKNSGNPSRDASHKAEQVSLRVEREMGSGRSPNRDAKRPFYSPKPTFGKIPSVSLISGARINSGGYSNGPGPLLCAPEISSARHVAPEQRTAKPSTRLAPRGPPLRPTRGTPGVNAARPAHPPASIRQPARARRGNPPRVPYLHSLCPVHTNPMHRSNSQLPRVLLLSTVHPALSVDRAPEPTHS